MVKKGWGSWRGGGSNKPSHDDGNGPNTKSDKTAAAAGSSSSNKANARKGRKTSSGTASGVGGGSRNVLSSSSGGRASSGGTGGGDAGGGGGRRKQFSRQSSLEMPMTPERLRSLEARRRAAATLQLETMEDHVEIYSQLLDAGAREFDRTRRLVLGLIKAAEHQQLLLQQQRETSNPAAVAGAGILKGPSSSTAPATGSSGNLGGSGRGAPSSVLLLLASSKEQACWEIQVEQLSRIEEKLSKGRKDYEKHVKDLETQGKALQGMRTAEEGVINAWGASSSVLDAAVLSFSLHSRHCLPSQGAASCDGYGRGYRAGLSPHSRNKAGQIENPNGTGVTLKKSQIMTSNKVKAYILSFRTLFLAISIDC